MSDQAAALPLQRRQPWEEIGDNLAFLAMVALVLLGMAYHGLPGFRGRAVGWGICAWLGCWVLLRFVAGRWTTGASRVEKLAALAALLPPAWCAIQLLPLPRQLVESLSPWHATMRMQAASAGVELPPTIPLAIRPDHAVETLAQGLAYACFFLAALQLASSRRGAWNLARLLALVGIGEGLAGLLQAAGTDRSHGSLVNPNHFAAQALMGLTVAAGYLLARENTSRRLRDSGFLLVPTGLICLGLLGWLFSLSRGSLFLGGGVTALWFLQRRVRRMSGPGITIATSFGLLLVAWVLSGDFANSRIAILRDQSGDRRQYAASMIRAGLESPWLGYGGRAAEPLLTQFATFPTEKTPIFAHNDLLQAPVEMGLAGFLPWLAVLSLALAAHRREWRRDLEDFGTSRLALRSAAGAACLACLLHAAVDFHLRIPSVGFVFLGCLALRLGRGTNWPPSEARS